jgi:predicted anti-sigma-YlaC factor YlaD
MAENDDAHCLRILALLPRFIENDFTAEESQSIEDHLDACPSCKAEYDAMASLVDTLESLPTIGVPASFKDAVMKHIPKAPKGGGGS